MLREQAERDRVERGRLASELADERRHTRELAGRLDQFHERYRADIDALIDALRAERDRQWWRLRR